jgi:hypothetical protein
MPGRWHAIGRHNNCLLMFSRLISLHMSILLILNSHPNAHSEASSPGDTYHFPTTDSANRLTITPCNILQSIFLLIGPGHRISLTGTAKSIYSRATKFLVSYIPSWFEVQRMGYKEAMTDVVMGIFSVFLNTRVSHKTAKILQVLMENQRDI